MVELRGRSAFGEGIEDIAGTRLAIRFLSPIPAIVLTARTLRAAEFAAVENATGVPLPGAPNTVNGNQRRWLWWGPEEWLLLDNDQLDGVAERLSRALGDAPHIITPLGSALASITLIGEAGRDVLARGCSLDLRLDCFPIGSCARTLLEHVPVTIHRRGPGVFELLVDASIARFTAGWLWQAAREFL